MSTITDVVAAFEQFKAEMALLHQVVQGDETTTVMTEHGLLPSLGKLVKDHQTQLGITAEGMMLYLATKMAAGVTQNIAAFSDSTTDGNNTTGWTANPVNADGTPVGTTNQATRAPNAYPAKAQALLRAMYGNNNINFWNAGYSGRKLSDGWALANYDKAVTLNPAYGVAHACLVGFGLNDINTVGSEYENHATQLRLLVTKLLVMGTIPIMMTCDAFYQTTPANRSSKETTLEIDQIKRMVAKEFRLPVFELGDEMLAWLNKNEEGYRWGDEQNDALHFGDNGHAFKACVIAKAFFPNIVTVKPGEFTKLAPMDVRANTLNTGAWTTVGKIGFAKNANYAAGTAPLQTALMTAWIWNEGVNTELIYRGISHESYVGTGVRPKVRVTEQIKNTVTNRIITAAGFNAEGGGSYRKTEMPYRVMHLPYGLSKVEYVSGDENSTGAYCGYFEFWHTPKGATSRNALQNTGYYQRIFTTGALMQVAFFPEFKDGSNIFGSMNDEKTTLLLDLELPVGTGVILATSATWAAGAAYGDKVYTFLFRSTDNKLGLFIGNSLSGTIAFANLATSASALTWTGNREKFRVSIERVADTQVLTVQSGYAPNGATVLSWSRTLSQTVVHFAGVFGGLFGNGSQVPANTIAAIHQAIIER